MLSYWPDRVKQGFMICDALPNLVVDEGVTVGRLMAAVCQTSGAMGAVLYNLDFRRPSLDSVHRLEEHRQY
jgi:hypothetical protein